MTAHKNTDATRGRGSVGSTFRWEKCASEQVHQPSDYTSFVLKNQCFKAESNKMSNEIELERARISAILHHEHAKALPALANALATSSGMPAEVAVSLLGAAMRDRDAAALAHSSEVDRLRKDFGAPRAGALGLGYAESTETKPTSQESVASWGAHVAHANKVVGNDGNVKPDPHGWGKSMRNAGVA